jgi:hypothetical protein
MQVFMNRFFLFAGIALAGSALMGVDACQRDVDFASFARVSASSTATDDDSTTGTPTGSVSPSNTPSSSPTRSGTPSVSPTEDDETPTPSSSASGTPTSTASTSAIRNNEMVVISRQVRSAMNALRSKGDGQSSASPSQQRSDAGNWLGNLYADEVVAGVVVDSDKDGFSDALEKDFGTDPENAASFPNIFVTDLTARLGVDDGDLDGLINSRETELGTDSSNPDTDSDGIGDGAEVLSSSNPLDAKSRPADGDGDGLSNDFESEIGSNPRAADTDGDGLWDDLELVVGSSFSDVDSDNDGILDGREVFQGSDPLRPETAG